MATIDVDKARTALLVMDFQQGIVDRLPEARQSLVLDRTRAVLDAARAAGILPIHVVVRLRTGYPDVSPRNRRASDNKAAGRLQEGSLETEIHPAVAPREGEPIVVKRRVGAFSYTDLGVILHSHDITTLVLCGISTSGVVLTTVRSGADMDYGLIVLEDCCGDPNPGVHQALMEGVFPSQATVAKVEDFIGALST